METKRLNELYILLDGTLDHGVLELDLAQPEGRFADCPFCGPDMPGAHPVRIYIQGEYMSIGCDRCGARGPRVRLGSNAIWRTIEDAIDEWNQRGRASHIEKENEWKRLRMKLDLP